MIRLMDRCPFLVFLVVGGTVLALAECAGSINESITAFVPGVTLDEHNHALSAALGLESWSAYVFRQHGSRKRVAAESRQAASASPTREWIAIETGRSVQGSEGGSHTDLVVVDTLAHQLARFEDVIYSAWSPEGERLAIVGGRYLGESEVPETYKVSVWDGRTGKLKNFPNRPFAAEWLGPDSLLLDFYRSTQILDLRTGRTSSTSFHGRHLSPDRRFSLGGNPESGPRVWDEGRAIDITLEIQRLMEGARIRPLPGPFWVPRADRGAVLCVPTCLYPDEQSREGKRSISCSTYVVDVSSRTVLARIPGRAVVSSADRKKAVFLRDNKLEFEDVTKP